MADAKTSATHNNTATTTAAVIHDTQASVAIAAHTIDTAADANTLDTAAAQKINAKATKENTKAINSII